MSLGERVKRFFAGSKLDKQRLAALGFGAFSAYGVISNINAGMHAFPCVVAARPVNGLRCSFVLTPAAPRSLRLASAYPGCCRQANLQHYGPRLSPLPAPTGCSVHTCPLPRPPSRAQAFSSR